MFFYSLSGTVIFARDPGLRPFLYFARVIDRIEKREAKITREIVIEDH